MKDKNLNPPVEKADFAKSLALKILLKKKEEDPNWHQLTKEEQEKELLEYDKSEFQVKIESMIGMLKMYREDFAGNRVPNFLPAHKKNSKEY